MTEEQKPCQWCGYYEDASAWHYDDCPILDDPMVIALENKIDELQMEIKKLKEMIE